MKQNLRRLMSPSFAVAVLALAVAVGGGTALGQNLIQIPNGSVTTKKLANHAVTGIKIANHAVGTTQLANPGAVSYIGASSAPFLNGWSSYPTSAGFGRARFYKDVAGVVHLDGIITGGTIDDFAFRLPKGFRPQFTEAFAVAAGTGGPVAEDIDVYANGEVFADGPANDAVALDGISFLAH